MSQEIDADAYTRPFSLTKTVRRDPYPAILPSNPSNSQEGKIIVRPSCGIILFFSWIRLEDVKMERLFSFLTYDNCR
jgi:hypothetical protein